MKKVYAVRNGKKTGIFETWEQCKEQVHGFRGAVYKSFPTKEEAISYLKLDQSEPAEPRPAAKGREDSGLKEAKAVLKKECQPKTVSGLPKGTMKAYVDGSFHAKEQVFGCGVVLLEEEKTSLYSEKSSDPDLCSMRNVAGEIMGAQVAMQYALEHGYQTLILYYDYEGIRQWPTGGWKTNKAGTIAYREAYEEICDRLRVSFCKVDAHTGDYFNELADLLAKSAVGIAF